MSGTIIKIGKVITKTAEKIMLNATNGDINLNAAKSVVVSSDKEITYSSYEAVTPDAQEDLLVKKVKGPKEVVVGKEYIFTAAVFSRKATPIELQSVKWAYKIDDGAIQHFKNPGTVIGGVVTKKIYIDEELWDNKTLKVYAYFQNPSDSVSVACDIKLFEKIFVVGTEQHYNTRENKLIFAAQAIREVKLNKENKADCITILIFTDGYNSKELTTFESNGKTFLDRLNFIKINSASEMINYINKGNEVISRENTKIKELKIFSHGLPSKITFGLGEVNILNMNIDNNLNQEFNKTHVNQLKKESFSNDARLYSYACRTGNNSENDSFEKEGYEVEYYPINPRTLITATEWFATREEAQKFYDNKNSWYINKGISIKRISAPLKVADIENSLAQKLADYLNISVYAYIVRSNYRNTWYDHEDRNYQKEYIEIEDKSIRIQKKPTSWDDAEALWNPNGAYGAVVGGNSPERLPKNLFKFTKGMKPKKEN
ncbi:hypothetical protein [Tenacibaculum ovolyticum]|uniref:hypothetical protein n=1 Tax=Tenacibaculum ovolyticum TaxID=104270 RepID=UPI0003FDF6B4|nr:hypothetical protein [Tenacibaculum ovolyticum]